MVREEPAASSRTPGCAQQGKGRVFYTASGHDERTWRNPGFHAPARERHPLGGRPAQAARRPEAVRVRRGQDAELLAEAQWGTQAEPIRDDAGAAVAGGVDASTSPCRTASASSCSRPSRDIVKPIAMAWDERGRLWVAETVDYPNDLQQPRARATTASRSARTPTATARPTSSPSSPTSSASRRASCFANGGLIVTQPPGHAVPQGHRRRRQGRRAQGAVHRLGHARHARRAEQPALRLRQLGLGHRRLLRLRRHRRRQARTSSARASSASSRTARRSSSSRRLSNNTWGLGFSEDGRRLRLDGQQRPQRLPARSPTATTRRVRGWYGQGSAEHRRQQAILPDHREGPAGGLARQVHRRGRARAVHGPQLPEGVLEPRRVRHRADRAPRRDVRARAATAAASSRSNGYNLLASDDEWTSPDRWPRSGRTGRVGDRLVQLHRPAQPDAARASRPARATRTRRRCATRRTGGSTGSSTRTSKPSPKPPLEAG